MSRATPAGFGRDSSVDGSLLILLGPEAPRLGRDLVRKVCSEQFGLEGDLTQLGGDRDQNLLLRTGAGDRFVVKVGNSQDDAPVLEMQASAVRRVRSVEPSVPLVDQVPTVDGSEWAAVASDAGAVNVIRVFRFAVGHHLSAESASLTAVGDLGRVCALLGRGLRGLFHPAGGRDLAWDARRVLELAPLVSLVESSARRAVVEKALVDFERVALPRLDQLRAQLIHNDVSFGNVLFDDEHRVSAVLDFGDLIHAPLICDLVAPAEHLLQRPDGLRALGTLVDSYRVVTPLEDEEVELLPVLLRARWAALALISLWRLERSPGMAEYVSRWQAGVWEMFERVDRLGERPWCQQVLRAVGAASGSGTPRRVSTASLAVARQRVFGPALSPLFYRSPLWLVRGEGSVVFDVDGRPYLDCYNNVPVVGHGHPQVVAAIARQARLLNTNVRYLHELPLELADRLVESMPSGLDQVLFANSGSEVNDLAWRMARSYTGSDGAVVTRDAYHGATFATAALSPEEWRGEAKFEHVVRIEPPDGYYGAHRREQVGWALRYAAEIDRAVDELGVRGQAPGALFVDTGWSSEGILAPPPEYLVELCRRWQEAGGLVVADEVQMGFGRSGSGLWGFQVHGIVPDLVTMGKPMGNGHPVAALVARRDIVERFSENGRWFSTFGGNPVAAAAALSVLDVIERQELVAHAGAMAQRLRVGLERLVGRHSKIGDLRQIGLLVGVELVEDRTTRAPFAAADVVEGMRGRGVLIGSTGPRGNVLKIRPPLVIKEEEVDQLVEALDATLTSLG